VLFEPDIEYSKSFSSHSFKLLAGYSYYNNVRKSFSVTNYDFDYDAFLYNNIGSGSALQNGLAEMGSNKQSNKLIAFYGRLMYNYQEKYLLSASIRREGSSRFGKNNKWGWFPAVSLAWRLNEEDFAKDLSWLNDLKIRIGYGVTGNQDIDNYLSLERMMVSNKLMYYNQEWVNAYEPASNPNPDLKWEKKDEYNFGFDYGLIDNRISGSVDFYYRLISDLLWNYDVPSPPNVFPKTTANVGEMSNKGLEIQLNVEPLRGSDYSWVSSFSYSMNRNKMISFSDESKGYNMEYLDMTPIKGTLSQRIVTGGPVGDYYALIYDGIDPNDPTKIIYKNMDGSVDENGNPTIDSRLDRVVVGNQYPKFELGWNNNFTYKNWDLSFFIRAIYGVSALNAERVWYESWNVLNGGLNILRSTLTNHPEYTGLEVYDNRFVEDASYLKLDNISLAHNFRFAKSSLRLYLTMENLLTLTKYSGVDPEKAIPESFNLQASGDGSDLLPYYPYTRKFLVGLSFKF
jgi:TonB-linked SusC/RagA family outer membrane protein